jgi:hypothetical protein
VAKVLPLTTDATLARDLRASLALRDGVPVGNTWASFKAAMEVLGVGDEDRVASIEFGVAQLGSSRIVRDDEADGIVIREV